MVDPIQGLRAHQHIILPLLARMLWADRRADRRQLEAVAAACALAGESDPAKWIHHASEPDLEALPRGMGPTVLAAAAWTATVDGRTHPEELALLDEIVHRLAIDDETAARMQTLGLGMAAMNGRPSPARLEALLRAAHHLSSSPPASAA